MGRLSVLTYMREAEISWKKGDALQTFDSHCLEKNYGVFNAKKLRIDFGTCV